MELSELSLPGCYLVRNEPLSDARGSFFKFYHSETYVQANIAMGFAEQYFTLSHAGVLRGMHLQLPPHQHGKLVTCLSGRILDVLLDLRRASPTCGNSLGIELSPERGQALYLPAGIAHGFLSLEDNSGVLYGTTSVHDPHCDTGVRWDSFGFVWPVNEPLISARDAALPALAAFDSPF